MRKRITEQDYKDIAGLFGLAEANAALDRDMARDRHAVKAARLLGGTADLEDWTISVGGLRCRAEDISTMEYAASGPKHALACRDSGGTYESRLADLVWDASGKFCGMTRSQRGAMPYTYEFRDGNGNLVARMGATESNVIAWAHACEGCPEQERARLEQVLQNTVGTQVVIAWHDTRTGPLPRTGYMYGA